jgi:hypothetical protein
VDQCFHFPHWLPLVSDSRQKPHLPSAAVLASVLALVAGKRTSRNSREKDRSHFPARRRGLVGPRSPSIATIGRV